MAKCDSCQAPIVWAITRNQTRIPLEGQRLDTGHIVPKQFTDGNLQPVDGSGKAIRVVYVKAGEGVYKTHFASCPDAKSWRKKR